MNYFKKLQHLSLLNCKMRSILNFERKLSLNLSELAPNYHYDHILGLISNFHCSEIGLEDNYKNWQSVIRSDVNCDHLSFNYYNGYSFRLTAFLKQNAIKINKSKLLHNIAKAVGLSGAQALKQRDDLSPEFIQFNFTHGEQDIIELITFNSVIIDVQISGYAFMGCNAKLEGDDTLMLFTPKSRMYVLPNASLSVVDTFQRGSFKYTVESHHPANKNYIVGFMTVIDRGVDGVDRARYEEDLQYKYGVNVAISNLKNIGQQYS